MLSFCKFLASANLGESHSIAFERCATEETLFAVEIVVVPVDFVSGEERNPGIEMEVWLWEK